MYIWPFFHSACQVLNCYYHIAVQVRHWSHNRCGAGCRWWGDPCSASIWGFCHASQHHAGGCGWQRRVPLSAPAASQRRHGPPHHCWVWGGQADQRGQVDLSMFDFKRNIAKDSYRIYSFTEPQASRLIQQTLKTDKKKKAQWSRLTHIIFSTGCNTTGDVYIQGKWWGKDGNKVRFHLWSVNVQMCMCSGHSPGLCCFWAVFVWDHEVDQGQFHQWWTMCMFGFTISCRWREGTTSNGLFVCLFEVIMEGMGDRLY